jgi:RecA-family ATPase
MIERKIIIGLITSTAYCQRIHDIWNTQLLESATARRLADWIWDYYTGYREAPGRQIESIYYNKLREGKLQKEIAEEIEQDILPGLSAEYESEDFSVEYLITETEKYFNERQLMMHTEAIQALLAAGKVEEAKKIVEEFKPLTATIVKLDPFIQTVRQIRKRKRKRPTLLLQPWLREGQTTIIYGNYGSGKSLFTISIAYMLGLQDYEAEGCEIGDWTVRHPTGTLYLDGELGEQEMEERIAQFEWMGHQRPDCRMQILSVPEYQLETEDSFLLSKRENQQKVVAWLREHPTYKLVVIDSISTLFGLEDENSNSEWNNKVNPLLRDLRAMGIAVLILHHAGKDGKRGLRGASAMGAMAHNIFKLANHPSKNVDDGEAWFVLTKDKQRASGFSFRAFGMHYAQNEDKTETHWDITRSIENN